MMGKSSYYASSSPAKVLRQLMCLKGPRVPLVRVKSHLSSLTPQLSSDSVKNDHIYQVKERTVGRCCICAHSPSSSDEGNGKKNSIVTFSPELCCHVQFLTFLSSSSSTDGLLTFCCVCLATVTRLLRLQEEVGEIQSRISVVLGLRSKLEEETAEYIGSQSSFFESDVDYFPNGAQEDDDDDDKKKDADHTFEDVSTDNDKTEAEFNYAAECIDSEMDDLPREEDEDKKDLEHTLHDAVVIVDVDMDLPEEPVKDEIEQQDNNEDMLRKTKDNNIDDTASVGEGKSSLDPVEDVACVHQKDSHGVDEIQSDTQRISQANLSKNPALALQCHASVCSVTPEGQTKCLRDAKTSLSLSAGLAHERTVHRQTSFKCYFCDKLLLSQVSLEGHVSTHTREQIPKNSTSRTTSGKNAQCRVCRKLLGDVSSLKRHVIRMHRSNLVDVDIDTLQLVCTSKDGTKVYVCPKCKYHRPARGLQSIKDHLRSVHHLNPVRKRVCQICHKTFARKETDIFHAHAHPDKNDPNKVCYTCAGCGKAFDTPKNWRQHWNRVHKQTWKRNGRQCHHCGKVFETSVTFKSHSRNCSVPQEDQTKCTVEACGKTFPTRAEKDDHERVIHKRLSSRKCYFCHKVLKYMEKHLRSHTLERPFVCDKCGKDFPNDWNWKKHTALCGATDKDREEHRRLMRDYHKNFVAKLHYGCDLCDETFGTKCKLNSHKRRDHDIT